MKPKRRNELFKKKLTVVWSLVRTETMLSHIARVFLVIMVVG